MENISLVSWDDMFVLDETLGAPEEPGPDALVVTMGEDARQAALPLARDHLRFDRHDLTDRLPTVG